MKTFKWRLALCGLQLLSIIASSAKIQFYKDKDFSDLHLEVELTDEGCYNIPSEKYGNVQSIITDTCFIAHEYPHCLPKSSNKYLPGKTVLSDSIESFGHKDPIRSLHSCNDHEGGPQLNLDLTTFIDHGNGETIPTVLERFDNVCTCVNVPKYIQEMSAHWSIDNHGNGLFAYFEPDCMVPNWHGRPVYIVPGHRPNSWYMDRLIRYQRGTPRKVQSLGPDRNSTYYSISCSEHHHDKIMKLELLEVSNSSIQQLDANLNDMGINLTTGANEDILHFFADNDFGGYRFGSRSTSMCTNFPKPVQRRWVNGIGSIKTRSCVIFYSALDCMERSIKIEAPGTTNLTSVWESTVTGERTLSLLYTRYPNWKWETKSYRVCNKDEGGSSLKVDILSSDKTVEPKDGPVILESYPKLCSCRNVPEYVQKLDKWFINNHGNEMMAYFAPDCSSTTYSPLRIPAGQSSYSFALGSFKNVDANTGIIHKIQSFGPDPTARYFHSTCNNNSLTLTIFGEGNTTRLNGGSFCGSDTTTEGALVGLLFMQVVNELQQISRKVEELKQLNQQTGFNFENVKTFFEGKLQMQKDEFKNLTNKIKDDLNDLFA